jgi:general transcription factor 3C polypeptide 5 (transcription factor C subunit 1)
MIKTLRLQLSIRLFSLCPNEDAKNFLRNAYELIERSKKQEALCRSQQLKENKEASDRHNGTEDQAGGNNSDSEDAEDDEEEDKESDGYESPPMADDVPDFTLDDPCILDMNLDRLCLIVGIYYFQTDPRFLLVFSWSVK